MPYSWDRHDLDLRQLVVNATRALLRAIERKPDLTAEQFAALADMFVTRYGRAAAGSALRALDNTRLDAGVFGDLPRPEVTAVVSAAQSRSSASWAWNTAGGDPRAAAVRFSGPLGRMIRQPARETVWNATRAAGTRYVRVPGVKACAFCLMLASRGAVYTKDTVTTTTGARGSKRPEGLRYHDNCDCQARESLTDADLPQVIRDLQDEWREATYGADGLPLPNQQDAWRQHIRKTRPGGETVRPPSIDDAQNSGLAKFKRVRVGGHAEEVAKVNPHYAAGDEFQYNCVHCVGTLEARMRGYDVTATGLPAELLPGRGRRIGDILGLLADADGEPRGMTKVLGKKNVAAEVETWPEGGRGWVIVEWQGKNRGAHVFSVTRTDSKAYFLDPQSNGIGPEAEEHFKKAKRTMYVVRVDDLQWRGDPSEFMREAQQ